MAVCPIGKRYAFTDWVTAVSTIKVNSPALRFEPMNTHLAVAIPTYSTTHAEFNYDMYDIFGSVYYQISYTN